ncbi:MAG: hypothetical protein K8S98_08175 [Planctomycetes bacterium]|nr:hypothetical protein [Planctomycetota bacterium]
MQTLARHRAERAQAVAVVGYKRHAHNLERWVGIVVWIALLAVLIVESR